MSAPPWMPLYVADYLADTGHLSTVEHGAYMLLIMNYWQNGGLPTDEHRLARICRMSIGEWSAVRDTLADLFGDGWKHGRIDREIASACETMSKRSAAGKRAASARYAGRMRNASETHAIGMRSVVQTHAPAGDGVGSNLEGSQTDQEEASTRASELDALENELREAAGQQDNPSPSLLDLSPIAKLIHAGYDLRVDVLPKLRAAAGQGKRPASWAYYVPMIVEGKAKTVPPKAQSPPVAPTAWITEDDPRWPQVSDRWLAEKGKPLKPTGSRYHPGQGVSVPTDWLKATA